MWTVYILQCRDGTLYTGITDNLPRRLAAHNAGRGAKYTRGRTPVVPVYQELCPDRSAALRRERAIKSLARPPAAATSRPPDHPPRHRRMLQAHGANFSESCKAAAEAHSVRPPGKAPESPQFPGGSPSLGGTKPPYRMFCFPYGGI